MQRRAREAFDARSSKYFIRRGRRRRVRYEFEWKDVGNGRFAAGWTNGPDSCFEDFCGKAPPRMSGTDLTNDIDDLVGTPGIPAYTLEAEEAWRTAYPELLTEAH